MQMFLLWQYVGIYSPQKDERLPLSHKKCISMASYKISAVINSYWASDKHWPSKYSDTFQKSLLKSIQCPNYSYKEMCIDYNA